MDKNTKKHPDFYDMVFGGFSTDIPIGRTLLSLAVVDLGVLVFQGLAHSGTPWSQRSLVSQLLTIFAPGFGAVCLALVFGANLERPSWRTWARAVAMVNVIVFFVLFIA